MENKGSTIYFTIPLALPPETGETTEPSAPAAWEKISPAELREAPGEGQPLYREKNNLEIMLEEDKEKCLHAGMDYYIAKPVNAEELYHTIARVMGKESGKPAPQLDPPEDLQEMLKRTEGNIQLMGELLQMFFQDYEQDRLALKESLEKQDARSLFAVAHGLKGELGNLGMKTAHEIAYELEKLAKGNKLEEAPSLA